MKTIIAAAIMGFVALTTYAGGNVSVSIGTTSDDEQQHQLFDSLTGIRLYNALQKQTELSCSEHWPARQRRKQAVSFAGIEKLHSDVWIDSGDLVFNGQTWRVILKRTLDGPSPHRLRRLDMPYTNVRIMVSLIGWYDNNLNAHRLDVSKTSTLSFGLENFETKSKNIKVNLPTDAIAAVAELQILDREDRFEPAYCRPTGAIRLLIVR